MFVSYREQNILEIYEGKSKIKGGPSQDDVQDVINSLLAAPSIQSLEKLAFLELKQSFINNQLIFTVSICTKFNLSFETEVDDNGGTLINVLGFARKSVLSQ